MHEVRELRRKRGDPDWDGTVWVSFDNAPWHKGVVLPERVQRVLLPPYSPDLHCVIEHVFGRIEPRLPLMCAERMLTAPGRRSKLDLARQVIEAAIREETTQPVIAADVRRLELVLRMVATDEDEAFEVVYKGRSRIFHGTGGNYAPKGWR